MPTFFGIEYPNVPEATDGVYEVVEGGSVPYFHGSCWSTKALSFFPNDQILKAFKDPPSEDFPFGQFEGSYLVNLSTWNVVNGTKAGLVVSKCLDKMAGCDFDIVGRTDLSDYPDCAERAAECVTELTAYRAYLAQFKTLFGEEGPVAENANAAIANSKLKLVYHWLFGPSDNYGKPPEVSDKGACGIWEQDWERMKGT